MHFEPPFDDLVPEIFEILLTIVEELLCIRLLLAKHLGNGRAEM